MVERLKAAVEKARAEREKALAGAGAPAAAPAPPASSPRAAAAGGAQPRGARAAPASDADALWAALEPFEPDPRHLEQHRIVTFDKSSPAYVAFDVLRTRILRVFRKHGWTRLGITSPTKGCGKTFVATNLALSFARDPNLRVMLMDLDLRLPALAKTLGVRRAEPARWFLDGDVPPEKYLRRIGDNMAIGLNGERIRDAAETIMHPRTGEVLADMTARYAPDIVVYDLPPMLSCDDVIGFLPQVDCMLLVASGDRTRPDSVTECERQLSDQTHLLGVLLNRAEDDETIKYGYYYS